MVEPIRAWPCRDNGHSFDTQPGGRERHPEGIGRTVIAAEDQLRGSMQPIGSAAKASCSSFVQSASGVSDEPCLAGMTA